MLAQPLVNLRCFRFVAQLLPQEKRPIERDIQRLLSTKSLESLEISPLGRLQILVLNFVLKFFGFSLRESLNLLEFLSDFPSYFNQPQGPFTITKYVFVVACKLPSILLYVCGVNISITRHLYTYKYGMIYIYIWCSVAHPPPPLWMGHGPPPPCGCGAVVGLCLFLMLLTFFGF